RNPEPGTRNPEPGTRNPEPGTRNPEPGALNLNPELFREIPEPFDTPFRFITQRYPPPYPGRHLREKSIPEGPRGGQCVTSVPFS
ncbi:hypothetical protein T484DRAFT_1613812, partial [Baffinella frigidus]